MRGFIVSTLLLVLTACSPLSRETPISPVTTPTIAAVAPTAPAPQPTSSSDSIGLQINGPADGAIVGTPRVTVAGSAEPGAVVSVNDDIFVIGSSGQFMDDVPLVQGLNVIEVIGSDTSGAEQSVELTVTYQP